jgi:hypothetical protein
MRDTRHECGRRRRGEPFYQWSPIIAFERTAGGRAELGRGARHLLENRANPRALGVGSALDLPALAVPLLSKRLIDP